MKIWRGKIWSELHQGLRIGFHKCFFSVADDRYGRIDKYEERVAIKLTLRSTTLLHTRYQGFKIGFHQYALSAET